MKAVKKKDEEKELLQQLKEKLHWYTMEASEEEFDEMAVESILYLLDKLEPVPEDVVPDVEEAWGRFRMAVGEEGMAVAEEDAVADAVEEDAETEDAEADAEAEDAEAEDGGLGRDEKRDITGRPENADAFVRPERLEGSGKPEKAGDLGEPEPADPSGMAELSGAAHASYEICMMEAENVREISGDAGSVPMSVPGGAVEVLSAVRRKFRKRNGAGKYYKYAVAVVLMAVVLIVLGDVQAGASRDTGFFHWLRRDETKIQMVTSPEDLDGKAEMEDADEYYDRDEVPEWAQEWRQIDMGFDMPENYEWQSYEFNELENLYKIASNYLDKTTKKEMLLGMVMYLDKISLNSEELLEFDYVESFVSDQKEMNIYFRVEETGASCYLIYFYEKNCQYYIQGRDNLDELKRLMCEYWIYVKKNITKEEIICNKMLFQVIYKIEG